MLIDDNLFLVKKPGLWRGEGGKVFLVEEVPVNG